MARPLPKDATNEPMESPPLVWAFPAVLLKAPWYDVGAAVEAAEDDMLIGEAPDAG